MDSVELIASGYEWECPSCEKLNKVIETLNIVTCRKCKKEYEVSAYFDAIGK